MKKAFTLIELLVVVLIIGILAAVALPQYQVAVGKTRLTEALMAVENLYKAEKVFYMTNGHYTTDLSELDYDVTNPHLSLAASGSGEQIYIHSRYLGEEAYLIKYLSNGRTECRVLTTGSKSAKQVCASITGGTEREIDTYSYWLF
jgi:prepilin-type N-terminal cleavage/methylation domain-containing protein